MTVRYKLLKDTYMHLDGQPQIVLSGTVFDAPDNFSIGPNEAQQLSPGESTSALLGNKTTSVRNVRTR